MTPPASAGMRTNLTMSLGSKRAKDALRTATALWNEFTGNHRRRLVARTAASARSRPPEGSWWYWRTARALAERVAGRRPAVAISRPLMAIMPVAGARDDCSWLPLTRLVAVVRIRPGNKLGYRLCFAIVVTCNVESRVA